MAADTFAPWLTRIAWIGVASAAVFTAIYFPAFAYLSRSLASPYPKVDVRRRLAAAAFDALLVLTAVVFAFILESVLLFVAGTAYTLLRDAIGGQSIGKFLYSLRVIRLDTSLPARPIHSAQRNAMWLLPGANLAAAILEVLAIVRDPQGQRLGDRIAVTQVVEGFGAREWIKLLRDGLAYEAMHSSRDARPLPDRARRQETGFGRMLIASTRRHTVRSVLVTTPACRAVNFATPSAPSARTTALGLSSAPIFSSNDAVRNSLLSPPKITRLISSRFA